MSASEWDSRGFHLFEEKKFVEAEQAFQESLKLEPNRASAWIGLGCTLALLNRNSESKAAMSEAFAADQSVALVVSADYMFIGRQFDQGRDALMTAMKTDKEVSASAAIWYRLAYSFAMQNNLGDAEFDMRMATELSPSEGRYWHTLGWVLNGVKKDKDAKRAFEQAKKLGFVADKSRPFW